MLAIQTTLHALIDHLSPAQLLFMCFVAALVILLVERAVHHDLDALGIVAFRVAWGHYREWLVLTGYRPRTVADYRRVLWDFAACLPLDKHGEPRWGARNVRKHAERWLIQPARTGPRRGQPRSARTRKHYTAALRAFYRWAAVTSDPPLLTRDLMAGLRAPKVAQSLPRNVRPEILAAVLQRAERSDERVALILWLAWGAGLRVSEIAGARIEDIDLGEEVWIRVTDGKGGKQRVVALHPSAHPFLRGWLAHRPGAGPLVEARDRHGNDNGQPLLPSSVSHLVGRWMRCNGFQVTAHQLRHTLATAMLDAADGMNILDVQEQLGHAHVSSTLVYVRGWGRRPAKWLEQVPDPRGEVR